MFYLSPACIVLHKGSKGSKLNIFIQSKLVANKDKDSLILPNSSEVAILKVCPPHM